MRVWDRRSVLAGTGALLAGPPATAAPRAFTDAEGELVRRTLREAPSHGIAPADLGLADGEPQTPAALRAALLLYARAQHGGRIPPDGFDRNWGLRPAYYAPARELDAALAQGRLATWIADLPPPFEGYRVLRDGMAVYRRLAKAGGWRPIPPGPDLAIGAGGPRVRLLRERLALEDVGVAHAPPIAPFDAQLAAAVRRLQARHGLMPTGVVSGRTLLALNAQPGERVRQIRANLERWRWVPRAWPADRMEVNIAAATFDLLAGGRPALSFLAAAGRPGDETPMLRSVVTEITLNPPWYVPPSIAAKELLPKARRDPGYLARERFERRMTGEGMRLVQLPGPESALGRFKFTFDNPYSVYLHDTPSRGAFAHASRSVSHGCVRLERPRDLAVRLLAPNGDQSPERIDAELAALKTVKLPLRRPMPVFLLYWTAFPAGDQLAFRDDVYGWDAELLRRLDAGATREIERLTNSPAW